MGIFPQITRSSCKSSSTPCTFPGTSRSRTKTARRFRSARVSLKHYQITQPSKQFLEAMVEKSRGASELGELLDPDRKSELEHYLWGLETIDFLLDAPSIRFAPDEFVSQLRKLQPRLSSSVPA